MLSQIDHRLHQIIELWMNGNLASLGRIPFLCAEIAELAGDQQFNCNFDQKLLFRAARLAAKAEQRFAACLEIQSRTGSYSTDGGLEISPRIATSAWEG